MTTINTTADAVRRIRERDALLAEALVAAGRAGEIATMIRAGINVERIPPPVVAEEAPTKAATSGPGLFDAAVSADRFRRQTEKAAPR